MTVLRQFADLFQIHFNISEGFGGPLNGFSVCCLTIVMPSAVDAKDENEVTGTTEILA
jgi:hypothetical protein